MKTRVLFVHQDGLITGSAISLINLVENLDKTRFEPVLLACGDGSLVTFFKDKGMVTYVYKFATIWTIPTPRFTEPAFYSNFKILLPDNGLRELLTEIRPDIVHVNDKASVKVGVVARSIGIKTVLHLRSTYSPNGSAIQVALSRLFVNKGADYLVAISEDELDGFENNRNKAVVYNSINIEKADKVLNDQVNQFRQEYAIDDDEIAIGYIGKFITHKGCWDFLNAIKKVVEKTERVKKKFFFIADIPPDDLNYGIRGKLNLIDTTHPMDYARRILKDAGVQEEVVFTGNRTDIFEVIKGLDVVVCVQRLWAIGRVGFEAAVMGKPSIVNNGMTGNSRIVVDGQTGLIVNSGDTEGLAAAIIYLVENPERRKEMGANGYHHARQYFDGRINAKKIEVIYQSLLSNSVSK